LCRRFCEVEEVEVCGTMSDTDTLGLRNQGDRNLWDEPDPRIKWALDLFDDQGFEDVHVMKKWYGPSIMGGIFVGGSILRNVLYSRPVRAAMPVHLASFAFAFVGTKFAMDVKAKRTADAEAVCRHYIMLHPERFPEPEMMKFGDKRCILPWPANHDDPLLDEKQ